MIGLSGLKKRGQNWEKPMADDWFEIIGRQRLVECPPDTDVQEWFAYRHANNRAESLEDIGYPIQVDIELNGGCNMKCPFCPHGYEDRPNDLMSVDCFKATVTQAIEIGARSIKLNYINEPFLRRDLEELIRWTKDQGVPNIYLVTNGTALTRKRREAVLRSGLTKLFVSVDAVTAETYNQQRLSGQFDKVVANLEAFIVERNARQLTHPLLCLNFLVNKINQHERKEFYKRWSGIADVISFQRMNEIPDNETGLAVDHHLPVAGCKFPFKQIVVTHKGDLLPCCKLSAPKIKVGNIATMTIAEAWKKTEYYRTLHKTNQWQDHPVCGPCMRCEA